MPTNLRQLATPTNRHLKHPELLALASEWFDDPIDPNVILFKDDETGFYKAIDLEALTRDEHPSCVWEQLDFYGGRSLICTDDCRIKVVELCAEPGSYYGPWRIINRQNEGVVGQSTGDAFETVTGPLMTLIGLPLPEPVPMPKGESEPAILPLPRACVGLVFPICSYGMDIWLEEYEVQIFNTLGQCIATVNIGEDQGEMIRMRDDEAHFLAALEKTLKEPVPNPPENAPRFRFETLPTRVPAGPPI